MDDYVSSKLELQNPEIVNLFKTIITELVKKEINKAPFNRMIPATVVSVEMDGTLTVEIMDDGVNLSGVLNRTGEVLIATNQVYILKINNSNSNFVATIKK